MPPVTDIMCHQHHGPPRALAWIIKGANLFQFSANNMTQIEGPRKRAESIRGCRLSLTLARERLKKTFRGETPYSPA